VYPVARITEERRSIQPEVHQAQGIHGRVDPAVKRELTGPLPLFRTVSAVGLVAVIYLLLLGLILDVLGGWGKRHLRGQSVAGRAMAVSLEEGLELGLQVATTPSPGVGPSTLSQAALHTPSTKRAGSWLA
jgi:hypothetical protein